MAILDRIKPDFLKSRNISTGPFRQMFNYSRIWRWAMLLTALVTLLPLVLITTLDYQVTRKSIESEHLLRTLRVGSNAKRTISYFLSERVSALSFIVRAKTYEELNDPDELAALLQNLRESFGGPYARNRPVGEYSCGARRLFADWTESQSVVGFAGLFRGAEEGKDGKHSNKRSA